MINYDKKRGDNMSVKTQATVSLIINFLIAAVTTGIIISYFFTESTFIKSTTEIFRFFTTDSNILAAVAAVVVMIFDIKIIRGKTEKIPQAAIFFKFAGTACLMITFLTSLFYLVPMYGFSFIFGGTFFHMHMTAPLMSLFSLCLFEKSDRLSFIKSHLAYVPMAAYAAVYFVMVNVIGEANGGWRDLYSFGENGIVFITIAIIAEDIIVVNLLRIAYNLGIKKQNKQSDSNN